MIKTTGGYRVYFPGDILPAGEHVMDRRGRVGGPDFDGLPVREPVIGFDLPDFDATYREACEWERIKQARAMQNDPVE